MSLFGAIDKMKNSSSEKDETRLVISVGRVVDTNDPNQMGRIRVYIPVIDRNTSLVGDLPFAMYCSPFAGHQHVQSRGPTANAYTTGPVAYGFFSVPKVGTDVVIAHLDGNPQYRIWFGALQGMYLAHTLPHGRFTFNNPKKPGELDGPLSSTESPIQPQYDNLTQAYTRTTAVASNDTATDTKPRVNFEWRSRGIDYQAAGLGPSQRSAPAQEISDIADDRDHSFTEPDGTKFKGGNFTQGYARSRIEPDVPYDPALVDGGTNLDPQVYCLTTPGFHAWAMDDRPENCRIRLRTTGGHTFILDDTNERIYVSTANGQNWVEMDQDGSIDVYSSRRVSIHAAMDVNIKTEGTFRVDAAKGIHLNSGGDTRITTSGNTEVSTTGDINVTNNGNVGIDTQGNINVLVQGNISQSSIGNTNIAGQNISVGANDAINIFAGTVLNLTSFTDTNILTNGTAAWTTLTTLNFLATAEFAVSAANISLNGSTPAQPAQEATSASQASSTTANQAYLNNRVPEHEPWGRIMMKQSATDQNSGNNYQLELDYNNKDVGRVELGETITRNVNWHR